MGLGAGCGSGAPSCGGALEAGETPRVPRRYDDVDARGEAGAEEFGGPGGVADEEDAVVRFGWGVLGDPVGGRGGGEGGTDGGGQAPGGGGRLGLAASRRRIGCGQDARVPRAGCGQDARVPRAGCGQDARVPRAGCGQDARVPRAGCGQDARVPRAGCGRDARGAGAGAELFEAFFELLPPLEAEVESVLAFGAGTAGAAGVAGAEAVGDRGKERRALDFGEGRLGVEADRLLFPEDARRNGTVGPHDDGVAGPGATGDRGPDPAAQAAAVVEPGAPAQQVAAEPDGAAVVEVGVGDELQTPAGRVLRGGGQLSPQGARILVVEQFVLGGDVRGRRHEPDVELAGADFLREARQIGKVGAVRFHPDEDQTQVGRRTAPNVVEEIDGTHQPDKRSADPNGFISFGTGAIHRHADRLHTRLADRLRLRRCERQQVGGEPQVRDAVTPRLADDVDEFRVYQRLGGTAQGDPVGAREEVGRDLAERLERHHAGGRQVPVEGQELQPVDRGEVAHLALQVAALGGVEDDLERSAAEKRGGHQVSRGFRLRRMRAGCPRSQAADAGRMPAFPGGGCGQDARVPRDGAVTTEPPALLRTHRGRSSFDATRRRC